jgi:hypothetical protein
MATLLENKEIVLALPEARRLYANIKEVIVGYYEQNNMLTFENVRTIANMVSYENTPINEALVRVIECENCITIMETV